MSRPNPAFLILALSALPPTARAADRAADLAAMIAARVLAVERRLGGTETRATVLETVVLNVERISKRHRRRRDMAAMTIGDDELHGKMTRLGRGCAALRRLGTDPAFMAGMNENLCGYLLHVLAFDEEATARLPPSRRGELRYGAVMPTQRRQNAAEGWDLFLEYVRRQGAERAGSEGAPWAAPAGREDAF